jgi:hypothetical protein
MLRHLKDRQRLWALTVLAAAVLGGAGYAAGRQLGSPPASADDPGVVNSAGPSATEFLPPGPDVTPEPGATPDPTKPCWYIPYGNQERLAPKFHGTLNGITFGVKEGPLPPCTGKLVTRPDWREAVRNTPFNLRIDRLAGSAELWGTPRVGQCSGDGRILFIIAELNMAAGPGVNSGGGAFQIFRGEGRWQQQEFSERLFSTGEIGGRPAVFVESPLPLIGQAAVVVVDEETGGSTMLLGSDVSLSVLKSLAEELYR